MQTMKGVRALTEIRLELMMLNGGRREGEDRRQGARRTPSPAD